MADNTTLNAGSGGDTIAADDIGGVKHQRVKISQGADGSATDVSSAAPLNVTLANTGANATPVVVDLGDNNDVTVTSGTITAVTEISNALPAGTNAIGKLAANSGVDIGDVDVTSVIPGTGATNLGKAEDAAHASGDTGVQVLAVRKATPANLSSADGDYEPLQVSAGRVWGSVVVDTALPAGTNAIGKLAANTGVDIGDVDVTSVVPGTGATNLGKAEDAAHSSGDTGVMALSVRRDADTSLVSADGDYAPLQVNSTGSLKVAITSGAGSGGTSIADNATFTRGTTSETPIGGVVETSAPTLTNGNVGALSLTTAGALRVAIASGGVAGVTEDAAAAGGEEGVMVLAVRRDSASSGVSADGDFAALSVDSNGALRVSGSSGSTQYTEDAASAGGETLTLAGAVRQDSISSSVSADGDYGSLKINSVGRLYTSATIDAALPAGTNAIGKLASNTGVTIGAVEIAAAQTLATVTNVATVGTSVTPGTSAAHLGKAEDAAAASGDTGVAVLAVRRDTPSSDVSAAGDYATLQVNSVGNLWTTPAAYATSGGATPFRAVSAASTNATSLKGSAGKLMSLVAVNLNAAARTVKFYNKATAPTVGTDTPVLTLVVPGNTAGAGAILPVPDCGIQFSTGIAYAMTTEVTDAGTTGVSASELVITGSYI